MSSTNQPNFMYDDYFDREFLIVLYSNNQEILDEMTVKICTAAEILFVNFLPPEKQLTQYREYIIPLYPGELEIIRFPRYIRIIDVLESTPPFLNWLKGLKFPPFSGGRLDPKMSATQVFEARRTYEFRKRLEIQWQSDECTEYQSDDDIDANTDNGTSDGDYTNVKPKRFRDRIFSIWKSFRRFFRRGGST